MKFISSINKHIYRAKFRTKLLIAFIFLISIPITVLGCKYYNTSIEAISALSSENAFEAVKKINQMMDGRLSKISERCYDITSDKSICDIFNNINPVDDYELVNSDKTLSQILLKYFPQEEDIYSVNLITSYYSFGSGFMPYKGFAESKLHASVQEGKGNLVWEPTYLFTDMMHQKDLVGVSDYKYLFSCARMVECFYIENGITTKLKPGKERPVLAVSFRESFFRKIISGSIPVDNTTYYVVSPTGRVAFCSDESKLASDLDSRWVMTVLKQGTGIRQETIDDSKMLVCFDKSVITGWSTVAVINPDILMKGTLSAIRDTTLYTTLFLFIISIIMAYLISMKITNPINRMLIAIQKAGEGDFSIKIPEEGLSEISRLIQKFNRMSEEIQQLIRENYEVKIHQKEAEIKALNFQLNPHFLYNTLNLMNCYAIEKGQQDMSKIIVALSKMLHYMAHSETDMCNLGEEIEWIENYIYIMNQRLGGQLSYRIDINPVLYKYKVPRLFLQPFIENVFVHGFESIDQLYVIDIKGWVEGDCRFFSVQDNGVGIDNMKLKTILNYDISSIGIKNVDLRVKMIYGENFGVSIDSELGIGTTVTICMPVEKDIKEAL